MMGFGFMGIGFLIFLGLIIAFIWVLSSKGSIDQFRISDQSNRLSPKEILDQRLAKGDITVQEYEQIKKSLEQ